MTAFSPGSFPLPSTSIPRALLSICNFYIRTFTVTSTTTQSHPRKYRIAGKVAPQTGRNAVLLFNRRRCSNPVFPGGKRFRINPLCFLNTELC